MTYSGVVFKHTQIQIPFVLIPLLLDDLLWVSCVILFIHLYGVLIPLLLDDLLWD